MSELINNREERARQQSDAADLFYHRQSQLKQIIRELHHGKSVAEVRATFKEAVGHISVAEISQLEQALMDEEGIPVSEVQRLCSVHADLFKGSIDEIHRPTHGAPEEQPGHPVHTWKRENREIERLVKFTLSLHMDHFRRDPNDDNRYQLLEDINLLYDVDKHYSRKENLLFPFLERYGIHGPTKVMWGVDDGIRIGIKEIKGLLTEYNGDADSLLGLMERVLQEVTDMIFKEEHILLPMALDTLTEDEWVQIADESAEIGYCLTAPERTWIPERAPEPSVTNTDASSLEQQAIDSANASHDQYSSHGETSGHGSQAGQPMTKAQHEEHNNSPSNHRSADAKMKRAGDDSTLQDGLIRMNTGIVSVKQLETLLNHLPVDLTFIDEHDVVRYFSHGKERIFARTRAVIGRTVQNCHPPQSVHVVNELLADFKAGRKEVEDFWIQMKDQFIYIRYFAVRDEEGTYMGTLEFTQNIKPIRELEGQKRILS